MASPVKIQAADVSRRQTIAGISIVAFMFFMFGFTSWINAILIPYFKLGFQLSHFGAYLVTFAFYISYLLFSVPSSYLLKKVGFKRGMMVGFWVMAVGALLFVPSARFMIYPMFLAGLFSIGAGLALLQSAANPYITILGSPERAAQRFSIMGIFNKGAGIVAPLLFAAVVFRVTDRETFDAIETMAAAEKEQVLSELVGRVAFPYAIVGVLLVLLGIFIRYSPLPDIDTENESAEVAEVNSGKTSIFQFPHLVLGVVALFFHVGTQIISIDTIISYADSMNIGLLEAKVFPSYTLAATIVSYMAGIIFIPKYFSQLLAFRVCVLLGLVFSVGILLLRGNVSFLGHHTDISIWLVSLLGLANGLVWPGIWSVALKGLGRFTKLGGSLLVMGLVGNAIMPSLYGLLADQLGGRMAYMILIPCYLFLIYYSFKGYKLKKW